MEFCVPGFPGVDANVPKVSFSAALTKQMTSSGTIVFDKIFVNKGNFYDPQTGETVSQKWNYRIFIILLVVI